MTTHVGAHPLGEPIVVALAIVTLVLVVAVFLLSTVAADRPPIGPPLPSVAPGPVTAR